MGKGIKTAGKWALGIGVAAAGIATAAFAMTKKVTGAFDDIAKNARKMGVSTDYYQEMEYWASQNGLSHENMEKSMKRLNQRLGQAAEGNEKYSNALTRLGVDMEAVKDGTVSTEEAMTQSIQALSEMENSQEKAALASELFGTKLSQELMPAIDSGALSIEDAKKKAEELGIVIGEDTLNAAEEFNDTWDDMTRMLTAVGQKILAELMPVFQNMMDWIMEHMPQIQEVFSFAFNIISEVISTVVTWIGTLITWIGSLYTNSEETFMGIWEVIQEVFAWIIEFLVETWEFIQEFWQEHGENLLNSAIEIFTAIWEAVQFALGQVWIIVQEVLGYIMPFIKDTLAKIFKFWDENGKNIMKVVKGAFAIVKSVISTVMPVVQGIISGAWNAISGIFTSATNLIMGIIKTFSSLLTGDWEGLWNGLKDTTLAVLNSIATLMKAPINLIIGTINGMINALNKIKIKLPKVPNWVPGLGGKGGGELGFNIPNIPSLATGGVVHDPTLAMIGDAGAGNPEIVTPEKMMRSIFAEGLQDHGGHNRNTSSMLSVVIAKMEELIKAIIQGSVIVLDDGTLVGRMEPKITEIQNRNKEVWERFKT